MRSAGAVAIRGTVIAAATLTLIGTLAAGRARASDASAAFDDAVAQLTAEADRLDQLDATPAPHFTRPHPGLQGRQLEFAPLALDRIPQPFTGNAYHDAYVRWHLIETVKAWLDDRARAADDPAAAAGEGSTNGTTRDDPRAAELREALTRLLRELPPELHGQKKAPGRFEPEQVQREYLSLRRRTLVMVGYPPFERRLHGEEALAYMEPAKRKRLEPVVERMKQLERMRRWVEDPDAKRHNARIRDLDIAAREYRADVIYVLAQSGDPHLLRRAAAEITRQVRQRQRAAFDMMLHLYRAAFDGHLSRYGERALAELAGELRLAARSADGYFEYQHGDEPPPNWLQPRQRNFADYAFHLIELASNPDLLADFRHRPPDPDDTSGAQRSARRDARPQPGTVTAETLDLDAVRNAIDRAAAELLDPSAANREAFPLDETLRADDELYKFSGYASGEGRYPRVVHRYAHRALIAWALRRAGVSYQDPRLLRHVHWALTSDFPYTLDRAMRLQMLHELGGAQWNPWVRRDLLWLTQALTDRGGFGYEYTGGTSSGWGDHANAQLGVLGLWAAQDAGVDVPLAVWKRIDTHWRLTQEPTPDDQPAGWAVGMLGRNRDDPEPANRTWTERQRDAQRDNLFQTTVTGPMTAGGVASLTLTERYLRGPDLTGTDRDNVSTELRKGLRWLDENFSLDDAGSADTAWSYYLWTVQRVAHATGRRSFHGVDLFTVPTVRLLNSQQRDGLWDDPFEQVSRHVASGFALLYLTDALRPVAIAKLRHDGPWNNRPHDLWNLVDHVSRQYEAPSTWQAVDLDLPTHRLLDGPLLYLASSQRLDLGDEQTRALRRYVESGGMVLLNPESASSPVVRSFQRLAEAVAPGHPLDPAPPDHPFYTLHEKLRPRVPIRVADNGVRPLVVLFGRDVSRDLQLNDPARTDAFALLSNIYLHAVGMEPKRTRLDRRHLVQRVLEPRRRLLAARVRHAGRFDPEPEALPQLRALLANEHDVALTIETVSADALGPHRLAFLTAVGDDAELPDDQARALRAWIEAGGTLWLDAAGGSPDAIDAARRLLAALFPDRASTPLPADSPIITGRDLPKGYDNHRVRYRLSLLRKMGPTYRPRLESVLLDDRPAVLFSPEDLTAGLAGLTHWSVHGYAIDSARQLAANAALLALHGSTRSSEPSP